jgi:putative ABC transport system permease protein
MLKNYFKIAWRNLLKNKLYSFINIMGLAFGMAVAMLIGLWLWDELTFNTYHQHYNNVVQVKVTQTFNGHVGTSDAMAVPVAAELRTKYANDFERVALTGWVDDDILSFGEKNLTIFLKYSHLKC